MHIGQKIKLKPFAETNQPEQEGAIIALDRTTCIIVLDEKYWINDWREDGYREVAYDQLEEIKK